MKSLRQTVVAAVLGTGLVVGVVGCTHERHEDIPPSAQLSLEGDKLLNYSAPADGKVYVYDAQRDRMVYSGDLKKGETITVDPDEDRVLIDGRVAFEDGLNAGNRHRVFFQRTEKEPDVDVAVKATETRVRTETRTETENLSEPDTNVDINID